jgi:chaperone modulatory protein CbpM
MSLQARWTLEELVAQCGVEPARVRQFMLNAWIQPAEREQLAFDEEDLARVKLINDLQQILGIHDEAIPVILHLIDQLNHMHREIKRRYGQQT